MSLPGPVVAIVGPTASGKSSLADHVAVALGGEVVSVDSMQVYRGMDIGTAKTPLDQRLVPLHMVDVCDPGVDFSVQVFQAECRECIDGFLRRGTPPILCGGTGLYLDSVIDEMRFPSGEKGDDNRARYEKLLADEGSDALYSLLRERDPKSAEIIHPNNSRRVVRALELLDEGKSYAEHHEGLLCRKPHYDARIWAVAMDRDRLYRRIEQRVDLMVTSGLLDEVKALREQGLTKNSTAGQAIGYKEILDYLDGEVSLDEAVKLIKVRTRHYAKRQLSWLRRDGRAQRLDMDQIDADEAVKAIVDDYRTATDRAAEEE